MKNTENRYDLIVIGAGLGAMTAAAIQARRGKRVLVLEKHKVLGGYASVFGRKGVTFDVSLHQIGGVRKTRVRGILEAAGVYEKLDFVKSPELSHLCLGPGQPAMIIPNGEMGKFRRELIARYPGEARAIRFWFWVMRRFGRQIGFFDRLRGANPVAQGVRLFLMPLFAPFLVVTSFWMPTLSAALRVKDEELKKILLHFSGYYGSPAGEINMLYPMASNYSYYSDGGYYIRGGGYAIVRHLSKVIRENGGKIRTGQEVEAILTEDGQVTGVRLDDAAQTVVSAPEVICGANPFTVYSKLLGNHPAAQRELERISVMEVGMTASVLYLKIDVPPEELNPALAGVYEFVEPPKQDERAYYKRFRERRDFSDTYDEDGFVLTIHSNGDPDALGGGKGALLDIFYCDNYDRWAALDEEAYRNRKKLEMEKMLDAAERHLPGLREHIEILELATPRTMEKFTSNRRGAIYGFSQTVDQSVRRRFAIKSPIRGLNFVSAWSNPGGGYEGVLRVADAYANPMSRAGIVIFLALIAAATQISTFIHLLSAAVGS